LALTAFGPCSGAFFQNNFERLGIHIGNALDDVDAKLPACSKVFGIVGLEKFGNRFLAAFFADEGT